MIQIKELLNSKIYKIFVVIFTVVFLIRTATIITKPKPYLSQESVNKNNVIASEQSGSNKNVQITIKDENLEKKIRTILGVYKRNLTSQDMEKIVSIDLNHNDIQTLEGIEYCVNLKNINLTSNNVKDIEPLKDLTKLEYINLHDNDVEDISALENLVKLKEIDLSSNNIKDIRSLKNLNELKRVDIYHNKVDDVSVLKNLENLEFVDVSQNRIKDIEQIKSIKSKKILDWGNDATLGR